MNTTNTTTLPARRSWISHIASPRTALVLAHDGADRITIRYEGSPKRVTIPFRASEWRVMRWSQG